MRINLFNFVVDYEFNRVVAEQAVSSLFSREGSEEFGGGRLKEACANRRCTFPFGVAGIASFSSSSSPATKWSRSSSSCLLFRTEEGEGIAERAPACKTKEERAGLVGQARGRIAAVARFALALFPLVAMAPGEGQSIRSGGAISSLAACARYFSRAREGGERELLFSLSGSSLPSLLLPSVRQSARREAQSSVSQSFRRGRFEERREERERPR